jgi:hypothetical protein
MSDQASKDLLARLRDPVNNWNSGLRFVAADEIERLQREVIEYRELSVKLATGAGHEPPVSPDYELPCDVRLPPNTFIGKGCKLSTLVNALKVRECGEHEFTQRDDLSPERVAAAKESLINRVMERMRAEAPAPPPEVWQPMNTAPKDGSSFVAWCVHTIENSIDRRILPVVARWREPDGWIWSGPTGVLTCWTAKPHRSFNCAHEPAFNYVDHKNECLACEQCGEALEDLQGVLGPTKIPEQQP